MSLQISAAMYQGDPGLFSFVGKALKGVASIAGKVVKTATGAVTGLARGGPLGAIAGGLAGAGVIKPPTMQAAQNLVYGRSAGMPYLPQTTGPGGVSLGGGLQVGPVSMGGGLNIGGQPSTYVNSNGQVCRGHINRTSYYSARRGGLVQAGTVCVPNRRMNPLNPRALTRSMRRLAGANKAMRAVEKQIQRLARKAGGGRRSGGSCGCRGRKK